MPKIATYGPQRVQTEVIRGPRAQNVPAGAFGGAVAQGFADLGKGIADMQQRIATTEAEEAMVKFERDKNKLFFDPEAGYFNTQGRDAYDAAGSANESLQKLQQQYTEGLKSDTAKALFRKASQVHLTRGNQDIMQHATKGMRAWEVATIEAQVENTVENAALYWNDDQRLGVQRALGRQAVIDGAKMQGIDGEALNERLQTYESSFTRTAIEAATLTSGRQGKEMLDKLGDRLEGPDRIKMQKSIDAKLKAEHTQFVSQQSVVRAGGIVDRFDSRSDIIDAVNEISDPELRDKTMREAMYQFGLRKQAESEARAEAYEAAEGFVAGGQSATQFQAQNPEAWERLSPKQQRSLESGTPVATDWVQFSDLMTMPKSELAKVDPTEYYDQLAPAQRKQLISAVKSAKNAGSSSEKVDSQIGRTRNAQVKSTVEQMFGKLSKLPDKKRPQVDAFYALIDSEVEYREQEKGGKLTSQEFTALLGEMTREVVIGRSVGGFDWLAPDKTLDISDIPVTDPETGENVIQQLSQYLRENGIPVTSDNLIKAYEQAK